MTQNLPGNTFPDDIFIHFFPGLKQGPSTPPTGGDKPSPTGGCGKERISVGLIRSPFIQGVFLRRGSSKLILQVMTELR
jgi:hypothetical protein